MKILTQDQTLSTQNPNDFVSRELCLVTNHDNTKSVMLNKWRFLGCCIMVISKHRFYAIKILKDCVKCSISKFLVYHTYLNKNG